MAGLQGLIAQLVQVLFSSGLSQKSDARESDPPTLDICQNAEFDDIGTLRTRKPYDLSAMPMIDTIGNNIFATTGPFRQLVQNGAELLMFTQTALYSWIAEKSAWALRDTYMAITIDENDVFGVNGDQTSVDRAELAGVVFFAWITGAQSQPLIAAIDKATGAVILAPTLADSSGHAASAVRLVPLQTRVLMIWKDASITRTAGISIDPANISTTVPAIPTVVSSSPNSGPFDVLQIPGLDTALMAVGESTTQYELFKITSAFVVTTTTKARGGNTALAIAIDPTGAFIQVARTVSSAPTLVVGDLINLATMADVFTGQAIGTISGTTVSHITCGYRGVQTGGQYRCYVFFSQDESGTPATGPFTLKGFKTSVNWVAPNNTLGAASMLGGDLGIASRAFSYGGFVYVWLVFAGQTPLFGGVTFPLSALQNTLFLYRDDAFLVAKSADNRAGGFITAVVLPNVQTIGAGVFSWGPTIRRIVPLTRGNTYSGRAPCDVTFTFDDNRARRTARFGKTLYVVGAQVMQYDGVSLTELGFHIYPWDQLANAAAGGAIGAGTYAIKSTYKSTNAVGEVDRSTTATISSLAVAAAGQIQIAEKAFYPTRKVGVNVEVWRTQVAPSQDAPFFLVSSLDPTVIAGNNAYIANDPTLDPHGAGLSFADVLADSAIGNLPANPENGSVLENLNPLPAKVILASDTRIFLADLAGEPNTVWYSKTRTDGFVASFNDALTIDVPAIGGKITALAFIDKVLVVFRQTAIYAYNGNGFDNSQGGTNYELARIISQDCGVSGSEAVATLDDGLLFRSNKGWYRIDLALGLHYVGAQVSNFDSDDIYAITVIPSSHQVRIVTDRRIILYDTLVNEWGEWTQVALAGVLWNGSHVIADSAGVYPQRTDFVGITYGWDIELAWQKANGLQGRGLFRKLKLLGEWRGAFKMRVRIANNYQTDGAGGWLYNLDETLPVSPSIPGGPLEFLIAPKLKRAQALKVRFTAVGLDGVSAPAGDTAKLIGVAYWIAPEDGPFQALPAAQKA